MSIEPKFPSAAEAKKGNWYSRRHQTGQEARDAKRAYEEQQQAKMDRARAQNEATAARKVKEADAN